MVENSEKTDYASAVQGNKIRDQLFAAFGSR
jgi:hypothetical protein